MGYHFLELSPSLLGSEPYPGCMIFPEKKVDEAHIRANMRLPARS
jgi:hypothetical protein